MTLEFKGLTQIKRCKAYNVLFMFHCFLEVHVLEVTFPFQYRDPPRGCH